MTDFLEWVAFLAANIALIGFSIGIARYGLLLQQIGFMATSLLGLYRAGMMPLMRGDHEPNLD